MACAGCGRDVSLVLTDLVAGISLKPCEGTGQVGTACATRGKEARERAWPEYRWSLRHA